MRKERTGAGGGVVQSLGRGLGLLEVIAARGGGVPLSEASRAIGLHPSTTHHLLQTLVRLGWVAQDERRAYRLGSKIFQLAGLATTEGPLGEMAGAYLTGLARAARETAHLAVQEHEQAVLIAKVDGGGPLRVTERVGTPRPMHCTAIGKVLLAWLPEAERAALAAAVPLRRYTPRTIVERAALERDLRRVRASGYAVDDEEFSPGVRCLAAPVFDFTGRVVAALGVSGPVLRLTRARMAGLSALVIDTARRLSGELGAAANGARRGKERP